MDDPLGMEVKTIPDSAISATSMESPAWPISEVVKTLEGSIVKFKRAIRNGEPMTADKGLEL